MAALFVCAALNLSAAEDNPLVKTQKDKISYSIGLDIGRNITNSQIDINLDALAAGLKSVITGSKPLLTEEESKEVMNAFRTEMQAKQQARMKEMQAKQAEKSKEQADKNKKEGEEFLAENKKKPGVVTTASGLQYKVITAGTGKKPAASDSVTTHYRGTLINGTKFDSSYDRGEPASFAVGGVIKGWTEALQLMPVGSKWQLFIPSELAYGDRGTGREIGPNATLLFDIELISIDAKPKTN